MGYYIKKLTEKRSSPHWKVQLISYKKIHCANSMAKKPKKEWDIPKFQWGDLGFNQHMTIEQARTRASQLNAIEKSKSFEERQQIYLRSRQQFERECRAVFPELFKSQFENQYIFGPGRSASQKDTSAHWNATQRLLLRLSLDPSDWFDHSPEFYSYFLEKKYSMSYICKILRITNLWGFFITRRLGKPFMPIPRPRGRQRRQLEEAYFQKRNRYRMESDPILPIDLKRVSGKLNVMDFNWLYLSVWLGLRPKEVDQLLNSDMVKYEILSDGTAVIWIFQTKLTSIPPDRRWKPIPLLFQEQKVIPEMISERDFKRPLVQTVKRHFGKGTTLYGGRKGFTDLMLSKGQRLEDISQWLGHRSIERTWRNYKDYRIFHFSRVS